MKYRLALALLLPLATAHAQDGAFGFEAGYSTFSSDELDIELSALYATFSYNWFMGEGWSNAMEVSVVRGITDERIGNFLVDLDPTFEVGIRIRRDFPDSRMSAYARAFYARVNIDGESTTSRLRAEDAAPGLGVGLEFRRIALGFTTYFDELANTTRLSLGYRFQ